MKRADSALEGIYEKDQATSAFIIATAIERYTGIFNELDPAPFKKRDINQDLRVFLEDCSADIPLKYNVILQFNLLKDAYLDAIHELVHVKQVLNGKNCNHQLRYIERPLEIEAYKTAVDKARALGLYENRIPDYLESDLINDDELRQLATTLELDSQQVTLEENTIKLKTPPY